MQISRWPLAAVPLAVLLVLGTPLVSQAQTPAEASVVFNTTGTAQPLSQALAELARQARLTLVASPALLAGKTAPALAGRFTPQQALDRLLAGTGLAGRIEAGALTVRQLPPPAPATPATPQAVELSTVLVTAERDALPSQGSVSAIGREEVERFAPATVADLLQGMPGVTAVNARNGVSVDVDIRGLQGDRVKVLVDGTQATSNTSKSYGGDGSHNYVDPDLLGGVTVEKGPTSGPHGAGTGGGVVHLNTLRAQDLLQEGRRHGLRLRGGLTSNGSDGTGFRTWDNSADVNVRTPGRNASGSIAGAWRLLDDKLELLAAHSQRRTGNYHAGERGDPSLSPYAPGSQVFNTSQDTRSTLLKARMALPHDQWAELSYNRLDSLYGETRITQFDYNVQQKELSEVSKDTWVLRYGWKPARNPWLDLRMNLWQAETDEFHAELVGYTPAASSDAGRSKSRGLELWNTSVLPLAWADVSLRYGASLQHDSTTGLTTNEPAGERVLRSGFLQTEARFNRWLSADAGLRQEAYTIEGRGASPSPIPGQGPMPFSLKNGHSERTGSVGIAFTPWEPLRIFARHSDGWRPPTGKEALRTYIERLELLRPERTRSREFGAAFERENLWRSGDRLSLRIARFDNRHDDYMARGLGSTGYYYYNLDAARFRGTEFDLGYDAGRVFVRYGQQRYDRAEFCGWRGLPCTSRFGDNFGINLYGMSLPARHTENITLGTRWLDRRLVLGLRAQFVSASSGSSFDPNTGQELSMGWAPYETYDLFGSWRFTQNLDMSFSIENLRNRYYLPALSSPAIAIPAPGRTAKITLTYTF